MRAFRSGLVLSAAWLLALGCGGGSGSGTDADGSVEEGTDGGTVEVPDGAPLAGLEVEPASDQVLEVVVGQPVPTLAYSATLNGSPISVAWGVNRGEIGTVEEGPDSDTVFTPSANAGGVVTITAGFNGEVIERRVQVKLTRTQNGPSGSNAELAQVPGSVADLTTGGGVGGVGGEGLGVPLADDDLVAALNTPTGDAAAQHLALLYPYDGTVWPRGLLAPLLQWTWDLGDADAIKIEMTTTSGSFSYSGTFGRPAILGTTGGNFIRHPVPQDAWTQATNTAGSAALDGSSDQLVLRVTVAKDGVGYGPIEHTYRVAPARLAGTIYYQSYGTNLAKNFTGAVGGDGAFGGAVLSIKVGDTGPALAAGSNGDATKCRVCHSVAADGSRLIAQTNQSDDTFGYAITPGGIAESSLANKTDFPGITPDGLYALTDGRKLLDLANGGAEVSTTGLDDIGDLGTPMFSPDGTKVVFNPMGGSAIAHPTRSLVVMAFDAATRTFSGAVEIVDNTGLSAETRPGWGAFFPDNASVVYQQQTAAGLEGNDEADLRTRRGAKAHLAWTLADGTGTSASLDQANGAGYLPQLASLVSLTCDADGDAVGGIDADHSDDVNLNYEPTVNPIASGGYAWVVFTSRRMYGNVATIPPFCSDPRGVDLITHITTKKLWVAAVDLSAPTGTDPSHPAFYLPAQELLAGNARGFWTLDPCRADGDSCETGDQCCNGFCSQTSSSGDGLVCSSTPSADCSQTQEACLNTADCCESSDSCINGFCASVVVE